MPLDLLAARQAIAQVVSTVADFKSVYHYEEYTETFDSLPVAMLFRDNTTMPGPGEPQGPFGALTRNFVWRIRAYVQVENHGDESQVFIDLLVVALIEAFADSDNIALLQASGIDQPALTDATQALLAGTQIPTALVEATLETVISWMP